MKKVLALLFASLFILTLSACNGDDPIADLQAQIDALQTTIIGLEGDVESLEIDMAALEDALALVSLQTRAALGHVEVHHGVGYDLVHGHYVGIARVTVADGVIIGATVDEYFLPYSWGVIGQIDDHEQPLADQFFVRGARNSHNIYAKYLVVAGFECVGHAEGEEGSQVPKYMCDIDGLQVEIEDWVAAAEANAKEYAESFGEFTTWADSEHNFIADENFERHATYETAGAPNVHILKSVAPYWRFGALGWLGNARATEAAVLGLSLSGNETVERGDDNLWRFDDVVTGATWNDFRDYFETLARAFNNAISK